MENISRIKIRAAIFSLVMGLIIFVGKILAYVLTNSSAVFSDAAESVVHIIATALVVYSIWLSNKPPDKSHFYGHGNIEYFSAGIEGFLIITAAFTIIYFAVHDIVLGAHPQNLDIGSAIIGAAGIVNIFVGYYMIKQGKKTNSIALIADGKHILTDSVTSIGVIIGLVLIIFTGYVILDPLIAIFVALNIVYTGFKLIRDSIGALMKETDPETLNKMIAMFNEIKKEYWIDLHHLRFWKSADKIFVDFHLTIPYYFSIKQAHFEEEFTEMKLNEVFVNAEARIHTDYCDEGLCRYCNYQKCDQRMEEKSLSINWSVDKLLGDPVNINSKRTND